MHPTAVERLAASCVLSLALGAALAAPDAGGAEGVEAARSRLFATSPPAMAVGGERSLVVVFTPDSWGCQAADAALASAVGGFAGEHREVAVFSLIPESRRTERPHAFGQPLPGHVLVLGDETMLRESRIAPLPRLEIWTSDGRLLLLKSYRHALEESVREELERTLGFLAAAPAG